MAPQPVNETTMFVVAGLGLILNAAIMWGLRRDQRHDLNIRSAYLHMLGDALGSIGIIAGAIAIRYTGWQRVDPLLSILIAVLIIWTAWDVIKESLNILLEGLPRGMQLQAVLASMRQVEGVLDVHDLHIWSLGSSTHALSCHVLIEDVPPSESEAILRRLNRCCASVTRSTTPRCSSSTPSAPSRRAAALSALRQQAEQLLSEHAAAALSGLITRTVSSPAMVPTTSGQLLPVERHGQRAGVGGGGLEHHQVLGDPDVQQEIGGDAREVRAARLADDLPIPCAVFTSPRSRMSRDRVTCVAATPRSFSARASSS